MKTLLPFTFFTDDLFALHSSLWKKTETGYSFELDLPGFSREEISISVEKGKIIILAEKNHSHERRSVRWTENLPEDLDYDKLEATLELGVLTLTSERKEKVVHKIEVK